MSANIQIYRGSYWGGLVSIQVYSCVKVHTEPLILCLLYVQNPDGLDKPFWMEERESALPSSPPTSMWVLFAGKWRKRGRTWSVCMSFVIKWLFINETTEPVWVTNKVKAFILFQFFVLCFNNGPLELFNFLAFCQFMFSVLIMHIRWTWSLQSITY